MQPYQGVFLGDTDSRWRRGGVGFVGRPASGDLRSLPVYESSYFVLARAIPADSEETLLLTLSQEDARIIVAATAAAASPVARSPVFDAFRRLNLLLRPYFGGSDGLGFECYNLLDLSAGGLAWWWWHVGLFLVRVAGLKFAAGAGAVAAVA